MGMSKKEYYMLVMILVIQNIIFIANDKKLFIAMAIFFSVVAIFMFVSNALKLNTENSLELSAKHF